MRKNRLRELLNAGQPTLGTHLHSSWPSVTELVGYAGNFDYIEFVAEYAPYDLYALENLGRAIDLFDHLGGMMKIEQEPRNYLTIRALGSGIQNVLFADIRSAADAEACVRAVRAEAPGSNGIHGVGMRRDVRFTIEPGSQGFVEALDQTVIALMIEKKSAIENLEAILTVPGIDMVQFGPADYAMSTGVAGQWSHPQVQEAERYMIETALKHGIHPRAEIQHPGQAQHYLDQGVKHFCVGTDMVTLWQYFKETGAAMRGLIGGEAGARPADENAHSGYRT